MIEGLDQKFYSSLPAHRPCRNRRRRYHHARGDRPAITPEGQLYRTARGRLPVALHPLRGTGRGSRRPGVAGERAHGARRHQRPVDLPPDLRPDDGAPSRCSRKSRPAALAGVLLLSDGRHNGPRPIEDAARRLGLQQAPVCSVVIGSSIGPKDACILDVRVPDAIYLDDRAIIQTDLKLDGLRGETVTVSLLKDNDQLETRDIEVTDNSLRTTVRFRPHPRPDRKSRNTLSTPASRPARPSSKTTAGNSRSRSPTTAPTSSSSIATPAGSSATCATCSTPATSQSICSTSCSIPTRLRTRRHRRSSRPQPIADSETLKPPPCRWIATSG